MQHLAGMLDALGEVAHQRPETIGSIVCHNKQVRLGGGLGNVHHFLYPRQRLRQAGAYREALAYHDLGSLRVTAGWEHESKPSTEVVATLEPNGAPAPFPDIRKYPATALQWDTPIPPPEAYGILAKMSAPTPSLTCGIFAPHLRASQRGRRSPSG